MRKLKHTDDHTVDERKCKTIRAYSEWISRNVLHRRCFLESSNLIHAVQFLRGVDIQGHSKQISHFVRRWNIPGGKKSESIKTTKQCKGALN